MDDRKKNGVSREEQKISSAERMSNDANDFS